MKVPGQALHLGRAGRVFKFLEQRRHPAAAAYSNHRADRRDKHHQCRPRDDLSAEVPRSHHSLFGKRGLFVV